MQHSYIDLHKMSKRATPNQILIYKHAILLFKLYNNTQSSLEWIALNFQQILKSRQLNFSISCNNSYKIGKNKLCNRLSLLNNKIPLSWLALTLESYKIKCKDKFLQ